MYRDFLILWRKFAHPHHNISVDLKKVWKHDTYAHTQTQ